MPSAPLSAIAGPFIIACVALFLVQSCLRSQRTANWVKDRLVAIANEKLVPELAIQHVERISSTEFDLQGITLTHPNGTTVASVYRAEVEFAKIPLPGESITVQELVLFRPRVELIETETGLLGLNPILKVTQDESTEEHRASEESPSELADDAGLSEVLELRELEIRSGSLRYTAQEQPDTPLVLEDILIATSLQPSGDAAWQDLQLHIGRDPDVQIKIDGRVDLDSWMLQIGELVLDAKLDAQTARSLPPAIQEAVRRSEINGDLTISAFGDVPLTDPRSADLRITTDFTEGSAVIGRSLVPIESVRASISVTPQGVSSRNIVAETAGGRIWGTLATETGIPGAPLTAVVRAKDIQIGHFSGDDRVTGQASLSGSMSFDTSPSTPRQTSHLGNFELTLSDASILTLPVFQQIAEVLDTIPAVQSSNGHRASASIELHADRLEIAQARFVTAAIAGDIQGSLGFDGTVDLEAKAGPLARARELLGPLGLPFAQLVELSKPYRITGPISDPNVKYLGATVIEGESP